MPVSIPDCPFFPTCRASVVIGDRWVSIDRQMLPCRHEPSVKELVERWKRQEGLSIWSDCGLSSLVQDYIPPRLPLPFSVVEEDDDGNSWPADLSDEQSAAAAEAKLLRQNMSNKLFALQQELRRYGEQIHARAMEQAQATYRVEYLEAV